MKPILPINKSVKTSQHRALDFDVYSYKGIFSFGFSLDWRFTGDHAPEFGVNLSVANLAGELRWYDVRHEEQNSK